MAYVGTFRRDNVDVVVALWLTCIDSGRYRGVHLSAISFVPFSHLRSAFYSPVLVRKPPLTAKMPGTVGTARLGYSSDDLQDVKQDFDLETRRARGGDTIVLRDTIVTIIVATLISIGLAASSFGRHMLVFDKLTKSSGKPRSRPPRLAFIGLAKLILSLKIMILLAILSIVSHNDTITYHPYAEPFRPFVHTAL